MFDKVLIGWYHARYHKNLKKAEAAKDSKDLYKFKKYIYKAEDAWKKIITINNKKKQLWQKKQRQEILRKTDQ